jgi:TfoX/Sxy family transcriptional regulator of competence genes
VAYDEELADRIREHLRDAPALREKRMFGGIAFLVNGNLAVSASGQGGLLLRVDPAETDQLVSESPARRFSMRGREMAGWLHVGAEALAGDDELARWLSTGVARARSLPPK